MSDRITDTDINREVGTLTALMREAGVIKDDTQLTLHLGSNGQAKHNNYLLIGKTNQWPNGIGGRTKKEAHAALKHMSTAIALVLEVQQDGRPIA